jgi:hypothetical protein
MVMLPASQASQSMRKIGLSKGASREEEGGVVEVIDAMVSPEVSTKVNTLS